MLKKFVSLILFVFCIQYAVFGWPDEAGGSDDVLVLHDDQHQYVIDKGLQVLEDETGELSFSDVYERRNTDSWKAQKKGVPNYGFSKSSFWFHFKVDNQSNVPLWYFHFDNALTRSLDVYLLKKGEILDIYQMGDRFEYAARPVDRRTYLFPIEWEKDDELEFYVRVQSNYAVQFPAKITKPTRYLESATQEDFFHGIFFGFILIVAIYNFFVFLETKDNSFLYYVLFALSNGLLQASQLGFGFKYLWPVTLELQQHMLAIALSLGMYFGTLFVIDFLNLKKQGRGQYYLMRLLSFVTVLLVVANLFLSENLVAQASFYVSLVLVPVVFLVGGYSWYRGNPGAAYFTLAWFSLLLGSVLYDLYMLGFVPWSIWWEHGVQIGSAIEIAVLSYALTVRLTARRRQKYTEELKIREQEQLAYYNQEKVLSREILSHEQMQLGVKRRTEKLQDVLTELSLVTNRLEEINVFDNLTGLVNKRGFETRVREEWERAYRDQKSVSLIRISICQFDELVRRFGRDRANECLKTTAQILQKIVSRPADLLARIDEAEFAAILPNTQESGTRHLAKGIEEKVAQHFSGVAGTDSTYQLKVEIRVSTEVPESLDDSELLWAYAEMPT